MSYPLSEGDNDSGVDESTQEKVSSDILLRFLEIHEYRL